MSSNNKDVSEELGSASDAGAIEVTFCRNCGGKQSEVSKYCPFCGQLIGSTDSLAVSALNVRKKLGLIGSSLLLCGVFTPIISLPIVGNISLLSNGRDSGIIILILAIASLLLALSNKYKGLWFTSALSILAMFFTFTQFKDAINLLREDASGNMFSGLANIAIQFQWGWMVLISGVILLLVCAGWKDKTVLEGKPKPDKSKWIESAPEVNKVEGGQGGQVFLVGLYKFLSLGKGIIQKIVGGLMAALSKMTDVYKQVKGNAKNTKALKTKVVIVIASIILIVVGFTLGFPQNDQPSSHANITPFTKGEVCKGVIASATKRPVNSMSAMYSGDMVIISYFRPDDDKRWIYRCKLEGNKGVWSMANGRWRTDVADSKITFKVVNEALYIYEVHADGSSEQKIFGKSSFERNYGRQLLK